MIRSRFVKAAAGCAGLLLCAKATLAADAPTQTQEAKKKIQFNNHSFLSGYLTPDMDSRLQGQTAAAIEFANPAANPWTRNEDTVHRVRVEALRAGKTAAKNYILDSLGISNWSIPLFTTSKAGMPALMTPDGQIRDDRARLRFGISHLAPRAQLMIPVTYGHVGIAADARGSFDASYESHSYTFRVAFGYDPRENTSTLTLGRRF